MLCLALTKINVMTMLPCRRGDLFTLCTNSQQQDSEVRKWQDYNLGYFPFKISKFAYLHFHVSFLFVHCFDKFITCPCWLIVCCFVVVFHFVFRPVFRWAPIVSCGRCWAPLEPIHRSVPSNSRLSLPPLPRHCLPLTF